MKSRMIGKWKFVPWLDIPMLVLAVVGIVTPFTELIGLVAGYVIFDVILTAARPPGETSTIRAWMRE